MSEKTIAPREAVITVVRPRPQDRLVLYSDRPLPPSAMASIGQLFEHAWASDKPIFLADGFRLVLVEGTADVVAPSISREMPEGG
jgi:hypothetical protein